MNKPLYFELNSKELEAELQKLKTQTGKNAMDLLSIKGATFYRSILKAQNGKKITAFNLRRLKKVKVDVKKIISKEDYYFIFGK